MLLLHLFAKEAILQILINAFFLSFRSVGQLFCILPSYIADHLKTALAYRK